MIKRSEIEKLYCGVFFLLKMKTFVSYKVITSNPECLRESIIAKVFIR